MTEENRKILVSQEIAKSKKNLAQAQEMMDLAHWDLASNRYYYSCYHVVQALIISDGLYAHTHAGLLTVFSKEYVKTGKLPMDYGALLSRLIQLRQKADYNCAFEVSQEEVENFGPIVNDFVEKVISIIEL